MNKTTHRFTKGLHLLVMAALLAGLGVMPMPVAYAATYVVDRFDDDAGATACTAAANDCSLRGAITTANGHSGADAITLPAGTYTLSIAGAGEDANATGDLDITDDLTIQGQATTTVQAHATRGVATDRVFHISGSTVTIKDMTIRHGNVAGFDDGGGIYNEGTLTLENVTVKDNDADYDGGGIHNDGNLTLTNCTVSGNEADNCGGGIHNGMYANLTLTNCTVSNNEVDCGGGIFNNGDLTLTNCTVSDNEADFGGGIFNDETADLTLTNCTVSGNKANGFGGGIHQTCFTADTLVLLADGSFKRIADVQVGDATLGYDFAANRQVTNVVQHTLQSETDSYLQINGLEVTESHPFAVGPDQWVEAGQLRVGDWVVGDGLTEITHVGRVYESISVYNLTVADTHNYYVSDGSDLFLVHNKPDGNGGQVDLNNVTITNNTADDDNDNDGDGGGIHQDGAATPNFRNTIIAGNIDKSTPTLDDCDGSLSSQGYNLVGNNTGCPSGGTGDQTTDDPKLGPLADNGGPTETHALLTGSPAIDAATDCTTVAGDAVTQDQRGEPRPADGDQDGTAVCDIGAYEAQPPPEPVGGAIVPVSKFGLLAPWLGLSALASLAALTVAVIRRRRG